MVLSQRANRLLHWLCTQALRTQLQDVVAETAAFAKQQRADAERSKRSYSQVPSQTSSLTVCTGFPECWEVVSAALARQ